MKIYFAGSIRGGRDDQELYLELIRILNNFGTVLTEHVGDKTLSNMGESIVSDAYIYERDMQWARESDVVVAEVSIPSLGVGYEIGQAQSMNKPVLCLRRNIEGKRLSAMISGNSYLKVFEYSSLDEVGVTLEKFFQTIS